MKNAACKYFKKYQAKVRPTCKCIPCREIYIDNLEGAIDDYKSEINPPPPEDRQKALEALDIVVVKLDALHQDHHQRGLDQFWLDKSYIIRAALQQQDSQASDNGSPLDFQSRSEGSIPSVCSTEQVMEKMAGALDGARMLIAAKVISNVMPKEQGAIYEALTAHNQYKRGE